ncbi:MAG TPA: pyridoxal phosphate-dependent aminotransferase [candidate division Zixibacteria bacterium]|nr:pyridoxal phosphate-dependent aminotransferase [candidate division Zixibacteria bacterium]HOZ08199.1 pyridoxal phosphate-dependent aminotransferase [candidate division Zixibacteria bacterium]
MKLSSNMALLRPSGTTAYFSRVRDLVHEGQDIVSLATGELHFATPEHVARAGMAAISEGHTKYTLSSGIRDLRTAIARFVSETHGLRFAPDQVVVASGSKQALFNALYAISGPGGEVIIPSPYYPSYPEQVKMAGAVPVLLPTRPEDGFQIDEPALRAAITDRSRAVIVNSPHNPTGAVCSESALRAVAAVARERGLWVITDDIYEAIVYPPAESYRLLRLAPDLADQVIIVSGFSKSYAMTGWRIGYAVGPRKVIEAMTLVQSHVTNNASSISQHAALAALEEPDFFRKDLVIRLQTQRDRALAALRAIPGITCPNADGAFYLFPDISGLLGGKVGDRPMMTSADLALFLLERHGVAVVPGSAFWAENHLRISYAAAEHRLVEGLRRLGEGVAQLRPRVRNGN